MPDDERRCPTCGALVTTDAAWCGQCFTPLTRDTPSPPSSAPAATVERADPYWPCSVCGGHNPIDAETCETCGTPFASVMRHGPERHEVRPREAFRRSLVFPGLGLARCGRPTDGFARAVLFGVCLGMALLVGLGGVGSSPATVAVFSLFSVCAIGVYLLAAWEAYRVAGGGRMLVSSRALLWALSGIILAGVGLLGFAVVTAGRR